MIIEEVLFNGHPNIQSNHPRTIEITKDRHLTLNGDCIVGINSNKACYNLIPELKAKIKDSESFVEIQLVVEPYTFIIQGRGQENLTLTHLHDIVLRKSKFVCNRTLAVDCNYSALQIPRKMVELLREPQITGTMIIKVE